MRRTQELSSYLSMFLMLIGGVAFMVAVLTRDWITDFIFWFIASLLEMNLAVISAIGSILVLFGFYLMLRLQFTV